MNNYFNNRHENKEIISKGMTIGVTHIDTPVIFQLKTAIQPMAVQSIGMSPIIHSVIKDTPFISFTLQLDKDKDFLYRDIMKCIKVTGGLIPIRSYELTQFVYPVEENPGLYAGVGSKLIPLAENENFSRIGSRTTKVQIDEIFSKFAKNELNIEEYADFFYKKYIPWYNVAYCQLYNAEGNAPILEMFVQPVDMFAYFPDGIALFLKDDDGVVLQEALQRYMNVHQGHILNPEMHKFFDNFSSLYLGTETNAQLSEKFGTIEKDIIDDNILLKKISQPVSLKFTDFINKPDTRIDLFSSNSKINFTYTTKSYSCKGYDSDENDENLINIKKHDLDKAEINLAPLYNKELNVDNYEIIKNSDELKKDAANILVEDGDTIKLIHLGNVENIPEEDKKDTVFRVYGLDTLETLKVSAFSDSTQTPMESNDSSRFQMHIYRILSRSSINDTNIITGTTITTNIFESIDLENLNTEYMSDALKKIHSVIYDQSYANNRFEELLKLIDNNFMIAYYFVAEMGTIHLYNILKANKQGNNYNNKFIDYSQDLSSHSRFIGTIPDADNINRYGLSLSSSYTKNYSPAEPINVLKTLMNDTINEFSKKMINYLYRYSKETIDDSHLEIVKKTLHDKLLENSSSPFKKKVLGFIKGIQKCNKNLTFKDTDILSNFNYISNETTPKKYYAVYCNNNDIKDLTLVSPSDPVSINKIKMSKKSNVLSENQEIVSIDREYDLGHAICLYSNESDLNKKSKLYNSFTTYSERQVLYPQAITAQKVPGTDVHVLSTSLVFNSRDTVSINYIFKKLYVLNDKIYINDKNNETFVLTQSPERINSVINEIQDEHLTIYPELSKPFKKLINSIDENYIQDRKIYKYTYTNPKEAYPLLYTNNGTFSKPSTIDNSDVIFTYNSQNKINTDILEALKYSLNYLFFEIDKGYKNVLDEFTLSPSPNDTYRLFYDTTIGGNTFFTFKGTISNNLSRTYGNTLSDYLYTTKKNVENGRRVCVNLSSGDMVSILKDAFERSGTQVYKSVLPIFDSNISNSLKDSKSTIIKSNNIIDESTFSKSDQSNIPTYQSLFSRLREACVFPLTLAKNFAKETVVKKYARDEYILDLYVAEIDSVINKINDIYNNAYGRISPAPITTVQGIDGKNINLVECEKDTAESLISLSQEMINFTEALDSIKELILPLTLAKPLTYIAKKLIINNNNDTSIVSANYIYQSNNTSITNSQTSIGGYFQHTGSTQERVILSIRTSNFSLMRQLMLMYYTNDFVSKNILDVEKSRTSYTEIQKTPAFTMLKNRAEKTFSQITKSDLSSVDFDYSFKIENDLLNSYGIRFGFIEDITINSVENKVGLYNMNITLVKTSPRELSNSNIKSFNRAPFKNVVTEHLISKVLEEYSFGREKTEYLENLSNLSTQYDKDLFKYNEIIGGTAGISFVALSTVATLFYSIIVDNRYSILRRYIGFNSLSNIEEISKKKLSEIFKEPTRENIIDITLALLTSLMMCNHSEFVKVFNNLNLLISEIKYPEANTTLNEKIDVGIKSISKNQLKLALDNLSYFTSNNLFKNIKIDKDKTFSSFLSNEQNMVDTVTNVVMKTINEMFDFYSIGNYDYFSYMHYLCLGMKYGFQKIKFEFSLPIDTINSVKNRREDGILSKLLHESLKDSLKESEINTIVYKYNEIHQILNQAISLYEYDNKQYQTKSNHNRLQYTSKWTIESIDTLNKIKKGLTFNITNTDSNIINKISNEDFSIESDKIVFYIPYTPTFIRILHTFQSLIRSHGYNNYNEIEELDPKIANDDSDSYDSPITKQLIEFFVTNNFKKYYTNIKVYKEITNEIEEDEVRNREIKKLIYSELQNIHKLNSKIVTYNITDTYKNRTSLVSTFDKIALENTLDKSIKTTYPLGNTVSGSKFTDCFVNFIILDSYNNVTKKDNGFKSDTWIESLDNMISKLNVDDNIFSKQIMEKSPNLKKNRYYTSLSEYINTTLFGTSTNIVSSVSEHVFKNEITPTIFAGKESVMSFLMCDDVYYWTSSSLMFGTFGGNNPYTSGYYNEGNYAQSMLPSVYCLPKGTIIKYLQMPELDDLSFHLILKSMLMGSKVNTNPAFYIYDQQTLSTIFTYMSQQTQDLATNIQNAITDTKPLDVKENIRLWVTEMKNNIINASSSARTLKQYINMLLANESRTMPDVIARLDSAIQILLSLNMYAYQEEYLLNRKTDSKEVTERKKQFISERQNNQTKLDQVNTIIESILTKNIYSIYEKKENTIVYKNLQSMITSFVNDMMTARRSVQLLDEFDAIGGLSAIDLDYQSTIEYVMNESNNLSDTFRNIITSLQNTSYSNLSSPVNNSDFYNNILKDFSSGTSEKKVHLCLAYPIVKILFTKEDIPDMLVFDEMFLYTNVVSVITHSSIKTSSSIATITVADPFDDLHNSLNRRLTRRRSALNPFEVTPSSTEGLSSFTFEVGTSVQVRMGYSRYLGEESIVFNGTVASINNDPSTGTKIINCNSFGSNLLTPYKSSSENITNDDAWRNVNKNNNLDPIDHTIVFGYLQQIFFNRPEAFSGLIRTNKFNSMNKSSEADSVIINSTSNRKVKAFGISMPGTNEHDVMSNMDKIDKLLYFSGLTSNVSTSFLENFKPVRPSTDTNILLPTDFIYEGNKTVWNMLKQMQLHYLNHYLLIRPLDNGESIVFAPMDSSYKFSSSMIGSNYNFEKLAEMVNPINQKDERIAEILLDMFNKKIPELSNLQKDNSKKTTDDVKSIFNNITINRNDEEFLTLYILASTYLSFLDESYKNKFTISNSVYSDVKEYLSNPSNKNEILGTMSIAYYSLMVYKETLKDTKSNSLYSDSLVLGSTAASASAGVALGATIAAGTVLSAAILVPLSILGATAAFAFGSSVFSQMSKEDVLYKSNKFFRNLYDNIIILSKNYRKISAIHSIYSPSIVFNDIQVLENANTISMSYFNPSTAIGGSLTQVSKLIGGGAAKTFTGNENAGTGGTSLMRNLLNFGFNLDERNVRNLSDTSRWLTMEFPFHEFLPGDKRRSTVTIQPNAVFIQQLGVDEDVVVASNIMRHVMNEYYGGNLILIGNPGIYVADKLYLNDTVNKMSGVVECREVTNIFSSSTGYITSITPSLYVTSDESILDGKRKGSYIGKMITQILLPVMLTAATVGTMFSLGKIASGATEVAGIRGLLGKLFKTFVPFKRMPNANDFAKGNKLRTVGKAIFKIAGSTFSLSISSKIFSNIIGIFNKTVNYPIKTLINNTPVTQNIVCLEKRGEPLISNLDGLDKAELLKKKSGIVNFRVQETFRNMMDIPSDEFEDYKKILENERFDN